MSAPSRGAVEITMMSAGPGVRKVARSVSAWARRRGCKVTLVLVKTPRGAAGE